jgi:protein gp37
MSEDSKIEWCDSTFNPWIGCTRIAPACDHCYAADMARRYGWAEWGNHPRQRTSAALWRAPLKWQRQAGEFYSVHGRRRRVFCASLADVFDNQVDPAWRADLWSDVIHATPDIDWLLLTKRPQNIAEMLPSFWDEIKGHVWLGTTVEDQEHADRNIPHLLKHDAAVRFVSVEPMLGPIDLALGRWVGLFSGRFNDPVTHDIDWVIAGGESGPHARPSHPDWFLDLRDQCATAGVPFLFKQWGEWAPGENATDRVPTSGQMAAWLREERPADWHIRRIGRAEAEETHRDDEPELWRLGKKQAGRMLGGIEHNGFPAGGGPP